MKLFNPNLLRWLIAISLLGICNVYGQDPIYETGSGGGGTSSSILPPDMFTPLPVELLYFRGAPQDNYVVLDWATASEYNNTHFEVERSAEGRRFQPFQNVHGAGDSRSRLHYQTVDDNPLPGRSYYRLKQVDFSGEVTFSKVISVSDCSNSHAFDFRSTSAALVELRSIDERKSTSDGSRPSPDSPGRSRDVVRRPGPSPERGASGGGGGRAPRSAGGWRTGSQSRHPRTASRCTGARRPG